MKAYLQITRLFTSTVLCSSNWNLDRFQSGIQVSHISECVKLRYYNPRWQHARRAHTDTLTSSEVLSASARLFAHSQSPAAPSPSPTPAAHTSGRLASSSFLASFLGVMLSQMSWSAVGEEGEADAEGEFSEERSASSSRTGSSCASDGGCSWMIGLQAYFGFAGASSADCFRFAPLQTAIRELLTDTRSYYAYARMDTHVARPTKLIIFPNRAECNNKLICPTATSPPPCIHPEHKDVLVWRVRLWNLKLTSGE